MVNKINNKDFKTVFSTIVLAGGLDDFFAWPKRKESLSHNFPEVNGLDVDLTQPRFEARQFKLSCVLEAHGDTEDLAKANFWNLWNGLFTEISATGVHDLYLGSLNKSFSVYYINQQNVSKMSYEGKRIVVSFDLIFGETDPNSNIPKVFLVDHNDRYLIA